MKNNFLVFQAIALQFLKVSIKAYQKKLIMRNKLIVNLVRKIKHLLIVNQNEPYIVQKCDRYGNLYWYVYNRRSSKSHTFGSELEVKAWLEQRYY